MSAKQRGKRTGKSVQGKAAKPGSGRKKAAQPTLPPALQTLFSRAVEQHKRGALQEAARGYSQILQQVPAHADSLHLSGLIAHAGGQSTQAATLIRRAIKASPRVAPYHFNLGVVQQALGQYQQAVDSYRQALRLNPDNLQAYENLGVALQDSGDEDGALKVYRQALERDAGSMIALKNLGTLYFNSGDTAAALACFDRALVISPADPELHAKRSGCLLRRSEFGAGWREYAWRTSESTYTATNPARSIGLPHWNGVDCGDRRVLVSAEQGIGDEIMFASCVPALAERVEACALECDPRLRRLFARSFPGVTVHAKNDFDPSDYDSHVLAGSLPLHFRRSADDFPQHSGYLRADPAQRAHWREQLAEMDDRPKIGIAWRGGRDPRAIRSRSIDLALWRRCFEGLNATLINLQYESAEAEVQSFNASSKARLYTLSGLDLFNDLEGLAALVAELDLVIAVDNSTVHLAGALGVPVWVLLPPGPERRWPDDSDTSPWYPAARLFRSGSAGESGWRQLLERVASELGEIAPRQKPELGAESKTAARLSAIMQNDKQPVVLLNDTSDWYHWGCSGTSLALHAQLRRRYGRVQGIPCSRTQRLPGIPTTAESFDSDTVFDAFVANNPQLIAQLESAKAVFINGEGTLHRGSPASASLLYLAYVSAQRLDKAVHLINHSCYPEGKEAAGEGSVTALYRRVYKSLAHVAIREPVSYRLMNSLGVDCVQSFDCLPLFIEHFYPQGVLSTDDKTLVLAGSVAWQGAEIGSLVSYLEAMLARGFRVKVLIGASAYLATDDVLFVQRLQQKLPGRIELVFALTERQWLDCIGSASLLVSGRFHHSIAAAFLETPFIVAHSNTPKITGLLEALAMPEALLPEGEPADQALLAMSDARLAAPADFRLDSDRRRTLLALAMDNFPAT